MRYSLSLIEGYNESLCKLSQKVYCLSRGNLKTCKPERNRFQTNRRVCRCSGVDEIPGGYPKKTVTTRKVKIENMNYFEQVMY